MHIRSNMTEQSIQRSIIKYLSNDGWLVFKTVKVIPNGYPDVIAHRGDVTVLLEVKTPSGRVSGVQAEQHKRLRAQGIPVFVVTSTTEVKHELEVLNRQSI